MSKEEKLEKTRMSSYEVLCIMRNCTPEQKDSFMEKIKKSVPSEDFTSKNEVKRLAYPIEKMETAEYLLLNFKTDRRRIAEVEETLKSPLVIRHMTINLDTEKKTKIKNSDKLQRNRKFRKPGPKIEKSSQEKPSKEVSQENENHLGAGN